MRFGSNFRGSTWWGEDVSRHSFTSNMKVYLMKQPVLGNLRLESSREWIKLQECPLSRCLTCRADVTQAHLFSWNRHSRSIQQNSWVTVKGQAFQATSDAVAQIEHMLLQSHHISHSHMQKRQSLQRGRLWWMYCPHSGRDIDQKGVMRRPSLWESTHVV